MRWLLLVALSLACSGVRPAPNADAGRLDCQGTGEPAVVFIPGASRGASDWDEVRRAVQAPVKTCAWDPPHTGPRSAGSDARRLLDALEGQAQRWVLVGHSYGGLVVRMAAASAPDRLAGALFVDSVHEDLFDPAQAVPVTKQQPIDWIPSFREATRVSYPRGVPVLALVADHRGTEGWERDLASQRKLVAAGNPGEVVVVERTGHHIPRDRPDAIAETVRRLLALPTVH
ncbi:alpha/beta fold hydrolase [Pyxidicoccus xibeiensis]|uniref:alpha/beta fold hydrolase n=1 Tax=Pyxidicoccus xibeiensis TaxID=2906759 RepID=UPI0020A7B64C|nr:alpha/beta hydrolase [Pyxidicoccus xibeiensis]MCP3143039.1 alpha/beta hydrolase [Pyxidicoccus xibeiensis]